MLLSIETTMHVPQCRIVASDILFFHMLTTYIYNAHGVIRHNTTYSHMEQYDTFTVTFCTRRRDVHSMAKLGDEANNGVSTAFIDQLISRLGDHPHVVVDLTRALDSINIPASAPNIPGAKVLIVKNGAGFFASCFDTDPPRAKSEVLRELRSMPYDRQAMLYKRLCASHARYTNKLDDYSQEPDLINGQGTVASFANYGCINTIRHSISQFLGRDTPLVGEVNNYFDARRCGIGWHGDAERQLWAAMRAGPGSSEMPLKFQWFHKSSPIGEIVSVDLDDGDVIFFSSWATGYNFNKGSLLTLRHAAGSSTCAYAKPKKRKETKNEQDTRKRVKNVFSDEFA